jgi:hypothetical protein
MASIIQMSGVIRNIDAGGAQCFFFQINQKQHKQGTLFCTNMFKWRAIKNKLKKKTDKQAKMKTMTRQCRFDSKDFSS